ncbi:uncharacterized protein FIBRA_07368 [Fibroporia radiculosa]|uniref:Acyl carrier protein n=1 Tax=Fibroporia radiculosa TaxID=599839 RepID=J4H4K7_9APHY|nr:uncharacterized protein FIBRA_07368 [Fibroporia radiculosa]CCM05159.1 predicted protein [Fibroporia radiculosa]
MSFLHLAARGVSHARFHRATAMLPHPPSRILQHAAYSASAGLSKTEITARVVDVLKGFEKVDPTKLSESSRFSEDLGLDSLDAVEVVMAVEEEFAIEIPDEEADEIKTVQQAIDYIAKTPEGPLYDPRTSTLHFVDIEQNKVYHLNIITLDFVVDTFEDPVTSLALRRNGKGLACTTSKGFALIEGNSTLHYLCQPLPSSHQPHTRFNDGACDYKGRYIAGTLYSPRYDVPGQLYMYDPETNLCDVIDQGPFTDSNGLGWSEDGKTMYFTDSLVNKIYAYDYEDGRLSGRRVFVDSTAHGLPEGTFPDGLCFDSAGGLWSARNLVTSLFEHEQIKTTLPKARDTARLAEKIITMGKKGDLPAFRRANAFLLKPSLVPKVFGSFAQRYASRPGGYTRIHKFGNRPGDNAPHAILELVDNPRDLRFEMTARTVGWELVGRRLGNDGPRALASTGITGLEKTVMHERALQPDERGQLRPKTRWNLQKVLRFRNEDSASELAVKAGDHADTLLAKSLSAMNKEAEKESDDTPYAGLKGLRLKAGQTLPGGARSALHIAQGVLGKEPTGRLRWFERRRLGVDKTDIWERA